MNAFVKGVQTLFTGPDTSQQEAAAKRQREQQGISLDAQQQALQNQDSIENAQVAKATRVPKGRRLLLAATGESGVSSTLGG